jgi:hypothetical protein
VTPINIFSAGYSIYHRPRFVAQKCRPAKIIDTDNGHPMTIVFHNNCAYKQITFFLFYRTWSANAPGNRKQWLRSDDSQGSPGFKSLPINSKSDEKDLSLKDRMTF